MLTACFVPRRIAHPHVGIHAQSCGNDVKKPRVGLFFFAQDPAGVLEIAHLYGNAQTVGITPVLLYKGAIGLGQRVHTDQFAFVLGHSE